MSPFRTTAILAVLLTACYLSPTVAAQNVIFVRADASSGGDGSSWEDAFESPHDAIEAARAGDEIWIAGGTYYPDQGQGITQGDRSASFALKEGVVMLGGFAGTEDRRSARDLSSSPTILSGDLQQDDGLDFANYADNSYHVVTAIGVDAATILGGVTITGGHADGNGTAAYGGGILIENASPAITNVVFARNKAVRGGAVYSTGGTPLLMNAVINGNEATLGAGVYLAGSDAELVNVTATANTATRGGAVHNEDSSPSIANSILWGNVALDGTGDPNAQLECEREGYPCSYADVDPDIIEASDSLADEVLDRLESGASADEIATWLGSHENVVDVLADDENATVRFRMAGGRPTWAFFDDFSLETEAAGKAHQHALHDQPAVTAPTGVVGDDPKQKHALVLEMVEYENERSSYPIGESRAIANVLAGIRGYEGRVNYQENSTSEQQVGVSSFAGWEGYDVIYVHTHGRQVCTEFIPPGETDPIEVDGCKTVLFSGTQFNTEYNFDADAGDGHTQVKFSIKYPDRVERANSIGISSDYIRSLYPAGVSDAIVIMAACESFKGNDLAMAVAGANTAFLGWSRIVRRSSSYAAYSTLIQELGETGLPLNKVFETLEEQGLHVDDFTYDGVPVESRLTQYQSGYDLRIREVIWAQHPLTGEDLPVDAAYPIVGEPGDGEPDEIPYLVKVDGVDNKPDEFIVHVEVNGFSGEPKKLSEGEPIDAEGNEWRLKGKVRVPFDAQQGEEISIRAWVELPEGGESEHEEDATLGNPELHFTSTIEGASDAGRTYTEVKAEVKLSLDEDLNFFYGEDTLEYIESTVDGDFQDCTVDIETFDSNLTVHEAIFPVQDAGNTYGVPTEVAVLPEKGISEEITITCPGAPSMTFESETWYSGFISFHTAEIDQSYPAVIVTGWQAGSGEIVAQRTYDQELGEIVEHTKLEIRAPVD